MRWSIQVARIAGTVVQIHVTFFLLLAWLAGTYYLQGGPQAAFDGTLFMLLIFACILLHEFGHALAARRYGIPTPTITLLPIGGVARLQRMPDEPREELVVAIAGPLVNVAIAAVLYIVLGGDADLAGLTHLGETHYGLLNKLYGVNVFLVVFNLVPAFPMDGGRVLRALLAFRLPYARATRIAASVGQALALAFGFLGLFGNPLLLLIAIFVFLGAGQEAAVVEMREKTRGLRVADAMLPDVSGFRGDERIQEAARDVIQSGRPAAVLVDESGHPAGMVTRQKLFRALREGRDQDRLETLTDDLQTVHASGVLNDALQLMQSEGHQALAVVDEGGALQGLLSLESVGEMLLLTSNTRGAPV